MILLWFILIIVVSYISLYIVAMFWWENKDPISVWKATIILSWLSILLNVFWVTWIAWMWIATIVSMITFMKILGFEPTASFIAWMLYSVIFYFILILILSIFQ